MIAALAAAPVLSIALLALTGRGRSLAPPRRDGAAGGARRYRAPARRRRRGDSRHRRVDGLARHRIRLPGQEDAGMGAPPAARRTDLHHRLRVGGDSRLFRARPGRAARADGVEQPARLLVPRGALPAWRHHAHGARALPLRLPDGAVDVPDAVVLRPRCRADARLVAPARLPAGRAAAGASGHRRRRRPRLDGSDERHRRSGVSRRQDTDSVDLHDLAQPRQPRRRRADRAGRARGHYGAGVARAACPPPPALRLAGPAAAAADAHAPARMACCPRRGALLRTDPSRLRGTGAAAPRPGHAPARARALPTVSRRR